MTYLSTAYEWLASLPILPFAMIAVLFVLIGAALYLVAWTVRALNLIEALLAISNADGGVVRTGFNFVGAGLDLINAQGEVVRTSLNVIEAKVDLMAAYLDQEFQHGHAEQEAPAAPPQVAGTQLSLDLPQGAAILPFRPEPASNGSGRAK